MQSSRRRRQALLSFRPGSLFATGEQGAWYDPSDFASLFQDSARTTPVTAATQPIGSLGDKTGRGNHAVQATAASRPLLNQEGTVPYYFDKFDGTDDSQASAAGGGATVGFFFSAACRIDAGAGTRRTIFSDTGTDTGIRVRVNASNTLELAVSNGAPIGTPVQAAATTSTTGGTGLAAATAYFYKITALNANGETIASNEQSVTTGAGTTNSNTVSWAAITGATGYIVYRGTVTNTQNVFYSVGNVVSYVDTGAANTAGSPPALGETAYVKIATVATADAAVNNVLTVWDDGTNLNSQINNGTIASVARPTPAAGSASFTLGKDNNAAAGFLNGAIFGIIYRQNTVTNADQRARIKTYLGSKMGLVL